MVFNGKVDFVVPWVDGSNVAWKNNYRQYENEIIDGDFNGEERFRTVLPLLRHWLTGAMQNSGWVDKIFILIDRTMLSWIPNDFPDKVRIVCHDEFIPSQYLPTFNSNVIELFIDKIPNLSEHFVLFNDDCYIVNPLSKQDFFTDSGLPVDSDVVLPLNTSINYSHILLNNLILINHKIDYAAYRSWFIKKAIFRFDVKSIKSILTVLCFGSFVGWHDEHMPVAYRKSEFNAVFTLFEQAREEQGLRRFRSRRDISHLLVRFWRLATGHYSPRKANKLGQFLEIENDGNHPKLQAILKTDAKIICVNDREMDPNIAELVYDGVDSIFTQYYREI